MAITWNRRKRLGKNTTLSMSKRGASVSERIGPVTVSSRGRVRVRLARGLSFRL